MAQFVGSPVMSIATAKVKADGLNSKLSLGTGTTPFEFPKTLTHHLSNAKVKADELTVGIRPEGVLVSQTEAKGYVPVTAHLIEPLGAYDIVDLKVGSQLVRARTASGYVSKVGAKVWVRLDPAQTHFFNSKTSDSLGIRLVDGAH